jgi:hypothetical protein
MTACFFCEKTVSAHSIPEPMNPNFPPSIVNLAYTYNSTNLQLTCSNANRRDLKMSTGGGTGYVSPTVQQLLYVHINETRTPIPWSTKGQKNLFLGKSKTQSSPPKHRPRQGQTPRKTQYKKVNPSPWVSSAKGPRNLAFQDRGTTEGVPLEARHEDKWHWWLAKTLKVQWTLCTYKPCLYCPTLAHWSP